MWVILSLIYLSKILIRIVLLGSSLSLTFTVALELPYQKSITGKCRPIEIAYMYIYCTYTKSSPPSKYLAMLDMLEPCKACRALPLS